MSSCAPVLFLSFPFCFHLHNRVLIRSLKHFLHILIGLAVSTPDNSETGLGVYLRFNDRPLPINEIAAFFPRPFPVNAGTAIVHQTMAILRKTLFRLADKDSYGLSINRILLKLTQ